MHSERQGLVPVHFLVLPEKVIWYRVRRFDLVFQSNNTHRSKSKANLQFELSKTAGIDDIALLTVANEKGTVVAST